MKIAALYDIHGNLPALEAILAEVAALDADVILIGGDIVAGPLPAPTLERLAQLGDKARYIRGNADREIVAAFDALPGATDPAAEQSDEAHTAQWVAGQLTRAQRDFLADLPAQLVYSIAGLGRILFCHATTRTDEEIFTPITPDDRLSVIFAAVPAEIVVCGHTHMQFERRVGDLRIVNAGSVGMPYADRPGAYWLWLTPTGAEFRWTPYDSEAAAQAILGSGYPQAQEFTAENVRAIPTAAEATAVFERMAEERWGGEYSRQPTHE